MASGSSGLAQALAPVLADPDPLGLSEFTGQLLSTRLGYALQGSGIDLTVMTIHGWSHIQSDPALRSATHAGYQAMRDQFAATVKKWQAAGTVDPQADPGRDRPAHHVDLPGLHRPARPGRRR